MYFFFYFFLLSPLYADTVTIDSCYDGDTCKTLNGERIRLACIDAPELKGWEANKTAAIKSKEFLNQLIAGEEVNIRRIAIDKYGRTVAELSNNQINYQELLVIKGHASIYRKYSDPCSWVKKRP